MNESIENKDVKNPSNFERVEIGKIVRGESHFIYWVLVNTEDEQRGLLKPEDSSYGTFVFIRSPEFRNINTAQTNANSLGGENAQPGLFREKGHYLIGIIGDTMLLDKDALRYGPRLANNTEKLNIIYPDFIDERIKIVKIIIVGHIRDGLAVHYFPRVSPNIGNCVYKMTTDDIKYFHTINGQPQIGYYSFVLEYSPYLMRNVLEQFGDIFTERREMVELLINNLEYHLKMKGGI